MGVSNVSSMFSNMITVFDLNVIVYVRRQPDGSRQATNYVLRCLKHEGLGGQGRRGLIVAIIDIMYGIQIEHLEHILVHMRRMLKMDILNSPHRQRHVLECRGSLKEDSIFITPKMVSCGRASVTKIEVSLQRCMRPETFSKSR